MPTVQIRPHEVIPIATPQTLSIAQALGAEKAIIQYHHARRALRRGNDIKKAAGYTGSLILSSIMPDHHLLDPQTLKHFSNTARQAGYDAVIAWDMPVYKDEPGTAWQNIHRSLQALHTLREEGHDIIPLVKGNTYAQIRYTASHIARLGYRTAALHATEYLQAIARHDYEARAILSMHLDILHTYFDTILLIGAINPAAINYIHRNWPHRYDKLAFAGLAWLLDAKNKKAYTTRRPHSLLRQVVKPPQGPPLTHTTPTRIIARHNLSRAAAAAQQSHQGGDKVYDAYTEPPILVVADIHLGRPDSCIQAAIQAAEQTNPKTIVLLGDIYDLNHPITLAHIAQLHTLASKARQTLILAGDAENPGRHGEKLLQALDRLTLHHPWTAPPPPPEPMHAHILHFYHHLRAAKTRATTLLPDGTTITYTHGHTFHTDNPHRAARRAHLLRLASGADHAVIAHLHSPHTYPQLHVTITGHSLKAPTPPAYTLIEDGEPAIIHPPRDAC